MQQLINDSLMIAQKRFETFGFSEAQIEKLLTSGKSDLEKEIGQLQKLLRASEYDYDAINKTLHALKGLLYNMGNNSAGDIMNELRGHLEDDDTIEKIKALITV